MYKLQKAQREEEEAVKWMDSTESRGFVADIFRIWKYIGNEKDQVVRTELQKFQHSATKTNGFFGSSGSGMGVGTPLKGSKRGYESQTINAVESFACFFLLCLRLS
jgi:hypothetical protein